MAHLIKTPYPVCPYCGGTGIITCDVCEGRGRITVNGIEKDCPACRHHGMIRCATCGTVISSGSYSLRVEGAKAVEVQQVSLALMKKMASHASPRSPWISGSFYLSVAVVILASMLTVGRLLPWYSVPVTIVGAILAIAVIGAFQLRQDQNLSEKSFLQLMTLAFRYLPLLRRRIESSETLPKEQDNTESPNGRNA